MTSGDPHRPAWRTPKGQHGGFTLGLVVGLLVGLALALGVALYMTKAPIPFVDKVPLRAGQSEAEEAARNKDWNPNAPLASKVPRPPATGAERDVDAPAADSTAAAGAAGGPPSTTPARDPAAILSGSPAPVPTPAAPAAPSIEVFVYFVQAGAFVQIEDAQAQRAKLAMVGQEARVFAREQAGRTVHRVRVGPFDTTAEAEDARDRLVKAGFEATLVRMDKAAAASQ